MGQSDLHFVYVFFYALNDKYIYFKQKRFSTSKPYWTVLQTGRLT